MPLKPAATFNPNACKPEKYRDPVNPEELGDLRDGHHYIFPEGAELAVRVALATGRPMLITGSPGSGKSALAPRVARCLGWRYYSHVISSRTQARDLLWTFDAVRRLSDAQVQQPAKHAWRRPRALAPDHEYVEPGILWWAFDPESAARRGGQATPYRKPVEPVEPGFEDVGDHSLPAVVLLDEIDKADPDLPNDLLVPLGSHQFMVPDLKRPIVARHKPLVIITSNRERELPAALLRRCIEIQLPNPGVDTLQMIAEAHFGPDKDGLYKWAAEQTVTLRDTRNDAGKGNPDLPSTAEFLDTIIAWKQLEGTGNAPSREDIARLTLEKRKGSEDAHVGW